MGSKKRSKVWLVSKDFLQELVNKSSSYGEVLLHLDLLNKGGNPSTLKRRLKADNIDESLLIQKRRAAQDKALSTCQEGKPIEEYLVENSSTNRTNLKRRLLVEGLLKNICYICQQLPEWNGKELVLQLDHINGISNDNRLDNLRMVCGHCHSQTENFAGRNKKY